MTTSGLDFLSDRYFSVAQFYWKQDDLLLFTGAQFFNDIGNYPDRKATYTQDYFIFQSGIAYKPFKNQNIKFMVDYNLNLLDYGSNDSIAISMQDQKTSFVAAIQYGQLKKNDFLFLVTYAHMQKYGAIDILAQNDWTRWSYGNVGSPAGRLTNYHGIELKVGYMVSDKIKLSSRFFMVEVLVKQGPSHENGTRIRFDIDIKL
ncbi:MAG: hypothetical protein MK078_09330 [Crocinitomicaceae bacterium]|nr:hypothetical protein [Crocinitomicaceae bacterium]